MEELLKEILHELRKINHKLYESDIPIKVAIGDEMLVEKVIENINKQSRISGKTTIAV